MKQYIVETPEDLKLEAGKEVKIIIGDNQPVVVRVLQEKATKIEKSLEEQLKEGYLAVKSERQEIEQEWACTVGDGLK